MTVKATVKTLQAMRGLVLGVTVVVAGGAAAFMAHALPKTTERPIGSSSTSTTAAETIQRSGTDGVVVPADIAAKLGLATEAAAYPNGGLKLPNFQGVLAFDTNHLSRVRSRFAGEVVELGRPTKDGEPYRVNDRIRKGDLLAVVWCKDLGEKKSELVDALLRLKAEEQLLARLKKLYEDGSGTERSVLDSERAVQAIRVDVARAERTLRTWRLTDADIKTLREEADHINTAQSGAGSTEWARVEIRSPQDGVLLEKNVAAGDIVDTATDLFKVGDVTQMTVWAHVYEEDLSLLQGLPRPVKWTIHLPSRPGTSFPGTLDTIGAVIDPNQHTALVSGRVANPTGDLKSGQSVSVAIEIPAPSGELELPAAAVVEDGRASLVFVQPNAEERRFVRCPVNVVRRFRDKVYVKADGPVHSGDRVVTGGALLLREAMEQLPANH
jgi:cobalt-zinc-cadmium efflux system membrane fusion protein